MFDSWQDWALIHPGNLWCYQSRVVEKRHRELQGAVLWDGSYSWVSSWLSSSSPVLPHPILLWVPLILCLWATHTSPSHITPFVLFAIMRCLRAWWQIYHETVLSKWPTILLERRQFSEWFFLVSSTSSSPEVSTYIPNACAGRKDIAWMYQFRETFSFPHSFHHSVSGPCDKAVPGDDARVGEEYP